MSDQEILDLKRVLVQHFSAQLRQEVDRVVTEKGYTDADFDQMLNEE